jgi:hypothetical protein
MTRKVRVRRKGENRRKREREREGDDVVTLTCGAPVLIQPPCQIKPGSKSPKNSE